MAGTEGLESVNHQASGWLSPNTALLIKADALFGWYLSALPPLPPVPSTLPPTIPHPLLKDCVCKGFFSTNSKAEYKCYGFEQMSSEPLQGKISLNQTYIGTYTLGPFSRAGTLEKQPSPLRHKPECQPQSSMYLLCPQSCQGTCRPIGEGTAGLITLLLTQAHREGGPGDMSALIKSKTFFKKNQVMKKCALFHYMLKRLDIFLLNFVSHLKKNPP